MLIVHKPFMFLGVPYSAGDTFDPEGADPRRVLQMVENRMVIEMSGMPAAKPKKRGRGRPRGSKTRPKKKAAPKRQHSLIPEEPAEAPAAEVASE